MTLVRWNPTRELASMEIDRLNRMFEDLCGAGGSWAPAVDIYETHDREYIIKAELPEMKREDINLTFDNNVLTLSGERKAEFEADNGTFHRSERAYGRFTRSFTLPATVDGNRISATYKDGVLSVRIPQREEAKPKQIEVQQ
ncbi:MAG TPA: Hsp20/alpha crystallin family protein [Vicinamibacterales bacterium]|nr:Hsp20/alpha crystallin family protein [Vicinamibacterales bacterium]